ncbi:MAG: hypothetical protein MK142_11285, partial [Pseudomonadales bacterium]|nr:hypothetical protein [Pseudomonadales bacterium]
MRERGYELLLATVRIGKFLDKAGILQRKRHQLRRTARQAALALIEESLDLVDAGPVEADDLVVSTQCHEQGAFDPGAPMPLDRQSSHRTAHLDFNDLVAAKTREEIG